MVKTRDSINKLPKAPSSDPSNEIANLLFRFVRDLARHVGGVPDENGLLQMIRPHQERFRRKVRQTAPDFVPFERRYAGTKKISTPEFLSSEEAIGEILEEPETPPECEEEVTFGSFGSRPGSLDGMICVDEVLQRAYEWVHLACFNPISSTNDDRPSTVHGRGNYLGTIPSLFNKLTSRPSPRDGKPPHTSSVAPFTRP